AAAHTSALRSRLSPVCRRDRDRLSRPHREVDWALEDRDGDFAVSTRAATRARRSERRHPNSLVLRYVDGADLEIQLVVSEDPEEYAVVIQTDTAEHRFRGDVSDVPKLIEHVRLEGVAHRERTRRAALLRLQVTSTVLPRNRPSARPTRVSPVHEVSTVRMFSQRLEPAPRFAGTTDEAATKQPFDQSPPQPWRAFERSIERHARGVRRGGLWISRPPVATATLSWGTSGSGSLEARYATDTKAIGTPASPRTDSRRPSRGKCWGRRFEGFGRLAGTTCSGPAPSRD